MSATVAVHMRHSVTVRQPVPVRQPVRLTRRGRFVVVLVLVVGLLVAGLTLGHAPTQAEAHVVAPRTVTVAAGETLWGLAERVAPHADPRLVVAAIEQLNHLASPVVVAGQQLVVPRAQ